MEINSEWLKCNPINDILQARENLLWIGRPNKEIYVRGHQDQRGIIKFCAWAFVAFVTIVAGADIIFSRSPIIWFGCVSALIVTPIFAFVYLAPQDYKHADWYALSEKRIFLVTWDHEDTEFTVCWTELSNLERTFVKKAKRYSAQDGDTTGNLCCVFRREIPKRISKKFTFRLIDSPFQVQKLLLDAKTASTI